MSNLQKSVMKSRLPPSARDFRGRQNDYTPTMWNEYFKESKDVVTDTGDVFRVYLSKPPIISGPILVLLHGGGFSALTWSLFSIEITDLIHCQTLAIDLRSHGDSKAEDEVDLSAETLAKDIGNVLSVMYPDNPPPFILVGHSMGGAIAVHASFLEVIPTLIGVTVIDVVEGTAMEALTSMQSFLRSRPTHFRSIPQAIEWSVRSGQIRNLDSAKVSMPGQIINCTTSKLSTNELPLSPTTTAPEEATNKLVNPMSIPEDESEGDINEDDDGPTTAKFKPPPSTTTSPPPVDLKKYTWRIDLGKSEVFWPGWFEGLSQKFLDLRVPKLLLLANIDGLDTTLTVGQMQGKFQMKVLSRCGHAVHEDRPHEVAEVIGNFLLRNKFAEAASEFIRQLPQC